MKELKIEFTGKKLPRTEQLQNVRDEIRTFVREDHDDSLLFVSFMNEIIKNVYDHAENRGHIHLKKESASIQFEIKDYGTGTYNIEELKKLPSSKEGSGVNSGIGLSLMIPGMAESLEIKDFLVDASCGFTYTGTWHFSPE